MRTSVPNTLISPAHATRIVNLRSGMLRAFGVSPSELDACRARTLTEAHQARVLRQSKMPDGASQIAVVAGGLLLAGCMARPIIDVARSNPQPALLIKSSVNVHEDAMPVRAKKLSFWLCHARRRSQ